MDNDLPDAHLTDTTNPEPTAHAVPVDPTPRHFHTARIALVVEGLVLIGWGVWGLIAAMNHPPAGVTGPEVLWIHLTWPHATLLVLTGVLAIAVARSYRWALRFSIVQAVGYALLFIVGAGHQNWFADPADDFLHAAIAIVGLVLLMWIGVRGIAGVRWVPRRRVQS
jgi:hypothetical protein